MDNIKTDKAEISKCYREMYRCMIDKDTIGLGCLLDNRFVLVHMTGMRQSKQEFQRCIANGTLNYYSCNDTWLDIEVNDRQANCTGKSEVNAAVFGGKRHTWNLRLDINFRKEDGRWLMTEATASVY